MFKLSDIKLSENLIGAIALVILVSFLFRYYLSDMIGVIAIVAIAFILFYFYSHLFECIARKSWDPIIKAPQTNVILLVLLMLLIGGVIGKNRDPRNAFWIMAIFLSMFMVVKLVLVEYFLRKEAKDEAEQLRQKRIKFHESMKDN